MVNRLAGQKLYISGAGAKDYPPNPSPDAHFACLVAQTFSLMLLE